MHTCQHGISAQLPPEAKAPMRLQIQPLFHHQGLCPFCVVQLPHSISRSHLQANTLHLQSLKILLYPPSHPQLSEAYSSQKRSFCQRVSNCGPQGSSISLTWEFVRNANPRHCLDFYAQESGLCPDSGDSGKHWGLRSTLRALQYVPTYITFCSLFLLQLNCCSQLVLRAGSLLLSSSLPSFFPKQILPISYC